MIRGCRWTERRLTFSQNYACPEHGVSIEELSPRMFSFNNPVRRLPEVHGLGDLYVAWIRIWILPNKTLSIRQGAIHASGWSYAEGGTIAQMYYEGLAAHYGFSLDTPLKDLPSKIIDILLYGTKGEKIKLVRQKEYGYGEYYDRI